MKTFSKEPGLEEKYLEIPCPLCGCREFHDHWELKSFSYVKCSSCNLVYQNPQPVAESIQERYDDDYFTYEVDNEEAFLNLILLGLKDIGFEPINIGSAEKKILDIGCATGLFLEHMKSLGWDTTGVEVCRSAAEYGNEKRDVNIHVGTIDSVKLEEGSFDVIHLSHVIEHINDPDSFLKTIFRLLKPGGVIYCTTPNIDGFQAGLFKDKWRSAIADHLVLFSIKTLKRIFRDNGFVVDNHKTWGGLCANSGYPDLFKKILDRAAKPLGFGDVVIIRAVKPA